MADPELEYVDEPYDGNLRRQKLAHFRDKGYAVLNDVFERDSVDAFREQVTDTLVEDDNGSLVMPDESPLSIAPVDAPRIRRVLPDALYYADHVSAGEPETGEYQPSLAKARWLVFGSDADVYPYDRDPDALASAGRDVDDDLYDLRTPGTPLNWHKDDSHEGMPPYAGYHHPLTVNVGMYFEDMTEEDGPTELIPRSHRDATLGAESENGEPMLIDKQDAFLWTQRLWHRSRPRTTPGVRTFAFFEFYLLPHRRDSSPRTMPAAQYRAWKEADPEEQAFYGGLFAPPE